MLGENFHESLIGFPIDGGGSDRNDIGTISLLRDQILSCIWFDAH